jgi:prophage regulatory protein
MNQQVTTTHKILRLNEIVEKTGLPKSSIYWLESRGQFPARIKLSVRSMGYLESEIDEWIAQKAAARHSKADA